jgi:sialate O-acetylesterase
MDGGIMSGPIGLFYDQDNAYLSQDLSGYWKFETATKENTEQKAIFNKRPDEVFVPGFWESLGYNDYDGYAFYSLSFDLEDGLLNEEDLYLVLGYIDDKDEVTLNGRKIGEVEDINRGSRNYYRIFRGYEIPDGLLRAYDNELTVRVYDSQGMGGIYEGPVGIARKDDYKKLKRKQEEMSDTYWLEFFKSFFE